VREDLDLTLAVNLKGTFFEVRLPGASRSGRRAVHHQSEFPGGSGRCRQSVYCMTHTIAHLTKCLAVEWGKYNITVNAVAPDIYPYPGTESRLAIEFHADVIAHCRAAPNW
jgi:NAD(P)-dependent dehydrogenase (short-subunit alcohol dehydrogenase family)